MKIALIGPGIMEIPPTGWGAVEILIWDYACELERLGHEVKIINTPDRREIIKECQEFKPDFIHIQYDDFFDLVKKIRGTRIAITSHFGYLEQVFESHHGRGYQHIFKGFKKILPHAYIFCLSEGIKNYYLRHGFPEHFLKVTPNGARSDLIEFQDECLFRDRSLYLAKIDYRKRQEKFRSYQANIYFAGNIADSTFTKDEYYLGEWSKEQVFTQLTHYANLVLLSDGEADPLVTKEALMAGLGLVVSEYAAANLDTTLSFIDVIPESKIDDRTFVKNVISENRLKSVNLRRQIKEYAKTFAWNQIVPKYIQTIESLT